jgi:hypothetical protein
MSQRKVITTCQFRRPEYTRQVLEALRGCVGIEEYTILAHIEPGDEEVHALIRAIDFAECRRVENPYVQDVSLNTENALRHGFLMADYVIHIEDDIVCAPDALRYYEWCRERYRDDPRVFSVTGYNRRSTPAPPEESHTVRLRQWFHPWGVATWKDRWERFQGQLFGCRADPWAVYLNKTYCSGGSPPQCHEVYPELSRSQNIGLEKARSSRSPEWYREHHMLKYWAGNTEVRDGTFVDAT